MGSYAELDVDKIIQNYLKKREYDNSRYHSKKNDPEYVKANRERASRWYADNREKKQQYYDNHKEIVKAKSQYKYWKDTKKDVEGFKEKYPERYFLLQNEGIISSADAHEDPEQPEEL